MVANGYDGGPWVDAEGFMFRYYLTFSIDQQTDFRHYIALTMRDAHTLDVKVIRYPQLLSLSNLQLLLIVLANG